MATFITWLSEKQSSGFVVEPANNIYTLPPELVRRGRLDEILFICIINVQVKELIVKVYLRRVVPNT